MHLAFALATLAFALGSLTFVIITGRKTERLYAEAEANWKRVAELNAQTSAIRDQARKNSH